MSALLLFRPLIQNRSSAVLIRCMLPYKTVRYASAKPSRAIAESKQNREISEDVKPLGEKIKENTKTASYMSIILLGVGVTGIMFYAIFRELFSSSSSNSVYSNALKRCIDDTRIQDALGAPIKGFGEETRRGRRRHVAHSVYEKNGKKFMRMQFYIQGCRNKGTVHLEMREVSTIHYVKSQ